MQNSKFSWGERRGIATVAVPSCGKKVGEGQAPLHSDAVLRVTEESFWALPRFISQLSESHMFRPNILRLLLFSAAANTTYSV